MVAYIDLGSNYYVFIMIIVLVGIQLLSNWNYLSARFAIEHSGLEVMLPNVESKSDNVSTFGKELLCFWPQLLFLSQEINVGYIQINLDPVGESKCKYLQMPTPLWNFICWCFWISLSIQLLLSCVCLVGVSRLGDFNHSSFVLGNPVERWLENEPLYGSIETNSFIPPT